MGYLNAWAFFAESEAEPSPRGAHRPRLKHEAIPKTRIEKPRMNDLDGDASVEEGVFREEHGSHRAAPERFDDTVRTPRDGERLGEMALLRFLRRKPRR
jgi:hypothetical protein